MSVLNINLKFLRVSIPVALTLLGLYPSALFAGIVDVTPDLKPWKYGSEIDANSGKNNNWGQF